MIENLTVADELLYHYTKASTALDYILKNRSLRLSKYTSTNDPKETKTWQFNLGTNEERDLGKYKMDEESAWLSRELKERARLACFCMDSPPLSGSHLDDIFKRGFCKPRMWAQYAERHSGVCLVFDRRRLAQAIEEQIASKHLVVFGPVKYIDRGIVPNLYRDQEYMINIDVLESVGRDAYPQLHLRTHVRSLFFEKMTDWNSECEWRWVAFSGTDEDLYVNFDDALVGLMFGEDTSEKTVQDMMDVTESCSLQYMGLKWKNCSPWYDYANLRYVPGIRNSPWGRHVRRV